MTRTHRIVAAAAIAALAAGCTGSNAGSATDDITQETTITFWHGWSAPTEVKAIKAGVDAFMAKHPKIKVKVVGNITDDKINQALRAGEGETPRGVLLAQTLIVGVIMIT